MSDKELNFPNYTFEVSWETCNKVGGIYTVLSTKASVLEKREMKQIFIGPDVWKETSINPNFIEDNDLFPVWKKNANSEGLLFRTGRWNIPSKPLAILVDFTTYFADKDKILANYWEKFKLDSLSGGWDYIEPALFGHATARVIESFYEFYLGTNDHIIAHFHEWMTGTGILYLKDRVPQIGTIFTSHATVLGRAIAGNGLPLYENMDAYNPDEIANRFGLKSKYSLEKLAAQHCDAFTTVSSITAEECRLFLKRSPDYITPNGFEDEFVPVGENFNIKRTAAREKLLQIAQAVLQQNVPDDAFLIINSGRYEYRNKGIDMFIDTLSELNEGEKLNKKVIAFITVPADQSGSIKELKKYIGAQIDQQTTPSGKYLTHGLHYPDSDQILNHLKAHNFNGIAANNVHVIYVPTYLNGADGIFDLNYYDLLIGFDLSVFPSYYEPWGYTPQESIAFGIPSITTDLAGFGRWMMEHKKTIDDGVSVIHRDDNNYHPAVIELRKLISNSVNLSTEKKIEQGQAASLLSKELLWPKLIKFYDQAYSDALEQAALRSDLYAYKSQPNVAHNMEVVKPNKPVWRKIFVKPVFPESLKDLRLLGRNLWWSWNIEAGELFNLIDPQKWSAYEHNPVAMLENLSFKRLKELENDASFMDKYHRVLADFHQYMDKKPIDGPDIAYFSMEYGLHDSLKIFSGGLGMLAGDYMKQASDSNAKMIGIGLLYRFGYFQQQLSIHGDQISQNLPQRFTHLPIDPVRDENGDWVKVSLALPGRNLVAKVWVVAVGRISLYLLDTDIPENSTIDRQVTYQLYGGDWENRFKQEMLLGVGGIRMLEALKIKPKICHLNEGHAAFAVLERLRYYVQIKHYSFVEAKEIIRASTLFTTHTPVPAGHDAFHQDLLRTYIPHYPARLNITWDEFVGLGRYNTSNMEEKFSMSVLATKMSQEVNGVSEIHGRVSREMFKDLFDGYYPEELFISYVTNGVHYPTWISDDWRRLHETTFGKDFINNQSDPKMWAKIHSVPDETIWALRNKMRSNMVEYLKQRISADMTNRQEKPRNILDTVEGLDPNKLTIGFARRFATYKRANLLFTNIERISAIINNPDRPVQFIFAGKAHPADKAGQDLIKNIIEISRRPEFVGKIFFVENYDMMLGKALTRGVDVWMNTPTRPLEASGTSGEKAVMNGVLNLSVLDGWWAEGYRPDAGWAIKEDRTYDTQQLQDELDAETIYNLLEDEVTRAFYTRNENDIPVEWVSMIKMNFAGIAPHFTMKRQLDDYYNKFYNKLINRVTIVKPNAYAELRKLAYWKQRTLNQWENIEVISVTAPQSTALALCLGDNFKASVVIFAPGMKIEELRMEIIFARKINNKIEMSGKDDMTVSETGKNQFTFNYERAVNDPGVIDFAFRLYPFHEMLPHRQDFPLVRWI